MDFFKPVYNGVYSAMKFLSTVAGVDFYAFVAIAVVVFTLIVSLFCLLFSSQAKTARRLIKINTYLLKNKKTKDPKFFEKFVELNSKGDNRVSIVWQGFMLTKSKKVSDVYKDSRIHSSFPTNYNFFERVSMIMALLLFVLSFGVIGTSGSTASVLTQIFEAAMFPLIIIVLNFIYVALYNAYNKSVQKNLIEYSKAISESVDTFFVDEQEKLTAAKQVFAQNAKIEIISDEDSSEIHEQRVYLEDSAELEKQREEIRMQFEKEIFDLKEKGKQLEEEIIKNRKELIEVRGQIKETDDANVIDSLKQQEDSQLKLINALEKLKGAQQKQYIEVEAKLESELNKIDDTLTERRKLAEESMKKELDTFATNLLNEKQKEFEIKSFNIIPSPVISAAQPTVSVAPIVTPAAVSQAPTSYVSPVQQAPVYVAPKAAPVAPIVVNEPSHVSTETAKPQPATGKRKNINEALSDLLSAMNKYNKDDTKK